MAIKDITGNKYGKLTVLSLDRYDSEKETTYWKCKCECGNEIIRAKSYLTSKRASNSIQSCGCYQKECAKTSIAKIHANKTHDNNKYRQTHGDAKSHFYNQYHGILRRCTNPNERSYMDYGGRGISCEWNSYEEFKRDMYDSYKQHVEKYGEKNTSIDRIDVDKNYNKDNCRWITLDEQRLNKTTTIYVDYDDGSSITLKELSVKLNIHYQTLLSRYKRSKYNHTHHIPYKEIIRDKDIV